MIYDYLFYNCYKVAERSGNFEDQLVTGAVLFASPCTIIHSLAFVAFIETLTESKNSLFTSDGNGGWAGVVIMVAFFLYYSRGGRYKKIIARFEKKAAPKSRPYFIVLMYYVVSFLLLFVAAMYKHRMWIFAS